MPSCTVALSPRRCCHARLPLTILCRQASVAPETVSRSRGFPLPSKSEITRPASSSSARSAAAKAALSDPRSPLQKLVAADQSRTGALSGRCSPCHSVCMVTNPRQTEREWCRFVVGVARAEATGAKAMHHTRARAQGELCRLVLYKSEEARRGSERLGAVK